MTYTVDQVIQDVRRALDEVTLEGVAVRDTTDFVDYASSNFSDSDLEDRIADAGRYIVARVQSRYLPAFIEAVTPADVSALEYNPDNESPPGSVENFSRLLGSRVSMAVNETQTPIEYAKASRWSFVLRRKHLTRKGITPNEYYPYYVFEDNEFMVESGSSADTGPGSAEVVTVPKTAVQTMNLPPQFRSAVIQYTVWSCFRTMMEIEQANLAQKRLYKTLGPYLLQRQDLRNQND